MMKIDSLLRPVLLGLAVLGLIAGGAASAQPMMTLEGSANGVRYAGDEKLRMSLLGWSDQEQRQAIADAVRDYRESGDAQALEELLGQRETMGYLFTKAAVGYSVKYAWREEGASDGARMVFLVTPALKTRNPMLWQEENRDPAPFSLLELRWQGDEATVKTSLDTGIAIDEGGNLRLENFDAPKVFATLADSTPYYAKQNTQISQAPE